VKPAPLQPADTLKYGWDDKYKGAFKPTVLPKKINRQPSSTPDEMALWRTEARSLRIMEMFEEASESMHSWLEPSPSPSRSASPSTSGSPSPSPSPCSHHHPPRTYPHTCPRQARR